MTKPQTLDTAIEESFGFRQVHRLGNDNKYRSRAEKVMLVWQKTQVLPAEQYRKAHFDGMKTDIAICQDPNVHQAYLGSERSLIYHINGSSSGRVSYR